MGSKKILRTKNQRWTATEIEPRSKGDYQKRATSYSLRLYSSSYTKIRSPQLRNTRPSSNPSATLTKRSWQQSNSSRSYLSLLHGAHSSFFAQSANNLVLLPFSCKISIATPSIAVSAISLLTMSENAQLCVKSFHGEIAFETRLDANWCSSSPFSPPRKQLHAGFFISFSSGTLSTAFSVAHTISVAVLWWQANNCCGPQIP